jgi:hypothetical protein
MPKRIQLRRTKGWRLPPGAVVVARPTKWGNPFRWQDIPAYKYHEDGEPYRVSDWWRRRWAVIDLKASLDPEYGIPVAGYPSRDEIRRELAGKDLACWCKLGDPCHADVLLAIANSGDSNA